MKNARLDELQARIKIDGRNVNNLRYADDTTLMTESEEKLKNLLMSVKEESERAGLKSGKEYNKAVLSPCFFNFYAEYIMRNARLDKVKAGMKIARRNISNLRCADYTIPR